jgi:hypothetical protein
MASEKVLLNRKRVNNWQKNNPDKYNFSQWKWALKRKYNLTVEEYEEIFNTQNGVCAICLNPETYVYNGRTYRLAVDHCHTTGKVRGLLCKDCNQILGRFNEDLDRFQRAIEYIKTHKEEGN